MTMSLNRWLQNLCSALAPIARRPKQARRSAMRTAVLRLHLESLEDRCLLALLAPVDYPVGANPQAVVTADFNNDGRLDLATPNSGDNTVGLLLGNANGTFQPAQTSTTGAYPQSLAVGDFNADGKLDLATANAGDVTLLPGNGDGTFQPPSHVNIGSSPASVAAGDFNGDGKLDLGVTLNLFVVDGYYTDEYGGSNSYGHYSGQARVLLGNGAGGFSEPDTAWLDDGYHTSAAVADFNGDNIHDFMTLNRDLGSITILLSDSSGHLQGRRDFPIARYPTSVAAADVNGDGVLDLVGHSSGNVGVLLGDGLGGFGTARNYATGTWSQSVAVADMNGDNLLDIVTSSHQYEAAAIYIGRLNVFQGYGDGTFASPTSQALTYGPSVTGLAVGDFDSNGLPDVAAATSTRVSGNVSVLINAGSWFSPATLTIGDVTVTEGDGGAVSAIFKVTRAANLERTVTVNYSTANGSALAGSDYQTASGALTFAPGETSKTIAVPVIGDRSAEPTENFIVNLSGATNALIVDSQGMGAILDNEPRISISDVTMKEGNGKKTTLFTFTVRLSAAYDQAVTMSYRTANGTAAAGDSDYIAKIGTLTFAPGETTKTITIEVKGDSKREANEHFYLDLFDNSSNSQLSKSRGLATILNDD
jgi:hypothetical protein